MAAVKTKRAAVYFTKNRLAARTIPVKYSTFNAQLVSKVFEPGAPPVSNLPLVDSIYDRHNPWTADPSIWYTLQPYLIEVLDAPVWNPLFQDWYLAGNLESLSYFALADIDTAGTVTQEYPKDHSPLRSIKSVLLITDEISEPTEGGALTGGPGYALIITSGSISSGLYTYKEIIQNSGTFTGDPDPAHVGKKGTLIRLGNNEAVTDETFKPYGNRAAAAIDGEVGGASAGAYVIKGLAATFSNIPPGSDYAAGAAPANVITKTAMALGLSELE